MGRLAGVAPLPGRRKRDLHAAVDAEDPVPPAAASHLAAVLSLVVGVLAAVGAAVNGIPAASFRDGPAAERTRARRQVVAKIRVPPRRHGCAHHETGEEAPPVEGLRKLQEKARGHTHGDAAGVSPPLDDAKAVPCGHRRGLTGARPRGRSASVGYRTPRARKLLRSSPRTWTRTPDIVNDFRRP